MGCAELMFMEVKLLWLFFEPEKVKNECSTVLS